MIMIRDPKTFYFYFDWSKNVEIQENSIKTIN